MAIPTAGLAPTTRTLLLCAVLGMAAAQASEIFRVVKPDGTVLYTDQPVPGAERLETGVGNHYSAPRATPRTAPDANDDRERTSPATIRDYAIELLEPEAEAAIRAPGGQFSVRVRIEPAPESELYAVATLNGERSGEPVAITDAETSLEVFSEIPGERHLQVLLLDDNEQPVARSASHRIHLLRRTLLQPAPANPAPNWNPGNN